MSKDQMTTDTRDSQTTTAPSRDQAISQITHFIVENKTWILTTCGSDHVIRSRPMLNVNDKFDGDLYFFANNGDEVIRSITENPRSNIVIAEPSKSRYVSITGAAKQIDDVKKAELLWNDRCKNWFEMDTPDQSIAVIRFDVDSAEYWDASQNIFGRISNLFAGSTPSTDNVEHRAVAWKGKGSSVN